MKRSRAVLILPALAALACTRGAHSNGQDGVAPAPSAPATNGERQIPEARQVGGAFVAVAQRVAPAVVRITTREAPLTTGGVNPFEGTPFEDFFRDFGPGRPSPEPRTGMGSGVVIDDRGHILTNHHVVARAEDVRVTFLDGKEVEGKVIGTDPQTDLAVLRVEGVTVKPAEFGSSEAMQVGEWVIAIGNPFGLDHSVTVGVLSAKGRYGIAPGKLEDFLQTDASINPGNSGGPLVNLSGQVVGINTMIAGIGTGVGFAVSEAIARPIAQQLIEHGKVTRPYIGISMQTLTPPLRQAMGKEAPEKGALVAEVQKGSPAEAAGIQPGDIVVRINDRPTADSREVQQAVLEQTVGKTVQVTVWRAGEELQLGVVTTELPTREPTPVQRGGDDRLGMSLQTLTPELAQRLGVDRTTRGVVITGVRPGSGASDAGLRAGDILIAIDNAPVTNARDAAQRLSSKREGGHLALIRRGDSTVFLVIPEPS